jgi:hypothetical protein
MTQVIEHLPIKCEALSSTPSPTKKKEKNDKNMEMLITLNLISADCTHVLKYHAVP